MRLFRWGGGGGGREVCIRASLEVRGVVFVCNLFFTWDMLVVWLA